MTKAEIIVRLTAECHKPGGVARAARLANVSRATIHLWRKGQRPSDYNMGNLACLLEAVPSEVWAAYAPGQGVTQ